MLVKVELLAKALHVIEVILDRVDGIHLAGSPGQLGEFESVVTRATADVSDRGPRLNFETFNDFARLFPFFTSRIVKQNKIFQEAKTISNVLISRVGKLFEFVFAREIFLQICVVVRREEIEEAMMKAIGNLALPLLLCS